MKMTDLFLAELEREAAATRRTLERVPDGRPDWKPHEKSMTLGALSSHVANITGWTASTFDGDELDVQPEGAEPYSEPEAKSTKELLEMFEKNVAAARAALEAATEEDWQCKWSLKMTGKTFFTLPRTAVIRGFILSHLIHHRAQLGVYLRLLDIPVPAIYGPSADEPS